MGRKITPILWSRQTQDGEKFIYIRLTENRKSSYFSIGKCIPPKYWNKEYKRVSIKYPSHQDINELIESKIREIEKNDLEILKGKNGSYLDFFLNYNLHLEKSNRIGTYKKFNVVYNHIKKFLEERYKTDLLFKEVTIDFLEKMNEYFVENEISQTTRRSYFKIIKNIFTKGLNRDMFIAYKNPFSNFRLPKEKSGHKSLTIEEFTRILKVHQRFNVDEKYMDIFKSTHHAANLFLFSFFSHGMRFGDLIRLKWGNIKGLGDRLEIHYTMNKTKKPSQVPVYDELIDVLRYYLHIKLKFVYLVMTNKDKGLFISLNDDQKEVLLRRELNGKKIKFSDTVNFNLRTDFDPTFYQSNPMKNLIQHNYDMVDRKFIKRLIITQVSHYKDEYVFPLFNKNKDELSPKQEYNFISTRLTMYNKELKNLKSLCKINQNISSHISRHTFSDLSRKFGSSIYDISKSLNHQDLNTTQHYFNSVDYDSVEETNTGFYDKINQELKKDTKKSNNNSQTS